MWPTSPVALQLGLYCPFFGRLNRQSRLRITVKIGRKACLRRETRVRIEVCRPISSKVSSQCLGRLIVDRLQLDLASGRSQHQTLGPLFSVTGDSQYQSSIRWDKVVEATGSGSVYVRSHVGGLVKKNADSSTRIRECQVRPDV